MHNKKEKEKQKHYSNITNKQPNTPFLLDFQSPFLSVHKYIKDPSIDIIKNRRFPNLRGTWLPSFDPQSDCGIAINWFGIRVRFSGMRKTKVIKLIN